MSASLSESAAPLRLDARQRDILAYMGLPMQGWPIASLDAQTPAARQGLVVDTMDPAVRSLRLIDLKKGDDSSVLPIEKIGEKTFEVWSNTGDESLKVKVEQPISDGITN